MVLESLKNFIDLLNIFVGAIIALILIAKLYNQLILIVKPYNQFWFGLGTSLAIYEILKYLQDHICIKLTHFATSISLIKIEFE